MAFSPSAEYGLTDLEMANCYDYEDDFDPDRAYDVEYEVRFYLHFGMLCFDMYKYQ